MNKNLPEILDMIRKVGNKFVLLSKSKKNGKRRRLGIFASRAAAEKRERQIKFFKNKKGS